MLLDLGAYYIGSIANNDAWKLCDFIVSNTDRPRRYFPKTLEQNLNLDLSRIFVDNKVGQYSKKDEFLFEIKEKEHRTIIGLAYIKEIDWNKKQAGLAYCIGYQYEGKGWASKVIKALSKCAFETLGPDTLQIITHKGNIESVKVAKDNGYTWLETLAKEHTLTDGTAMGMEPCELTNREHSPN